MEVVVLLMVVVSLVVYFFPAAVAAARGKSNTGAITLLNFLLGWSLIGWVIALVMACGVEPKK